MSSSRTSMVQNYGYIQNMKPISYRSEEDDFVEVSLELFERSDGGSEEE